MAGFSLVWSAVVFATIAIDSGTKTGPKPRRRSYRESPSGSETKVGLTEENQFPCLYRNSSFSEVGTWLLPSTY